MEQRLSPLPAVVRHELLSDLSQHFDYGLANGKSETEIAHELGTQRILPEKHWMFPM
ncbi:DUF1700 domain-containing protein [Paenibacillus polymyxa]|uniref:hypothetical protein n=1 Tax=Paenibacillus polymyxa TaxID=1406 RepID=UPI003D26D6A3